PILLPICWRRAVDLHFLGGRIAIRYPTGDRALLGTVPGARDEPQRPSPYPALAASRGIDAGLPDLSEYAIRVFWSQHGSPCQFRTSSAAPQAGPARSCPYDRFRASRTTASRPESRDSPTARLRVLGKTTKSRRYTRGSAAESRAHGAVPTCAARRL